MFLLREERPITRHASLHQFRTERFENVSSRHSANSEMFSPIAPREEERSLFPSREFLPSSPVQKTGPINARLPNIAKTRESNPLENLRTAPRCGRRGRCRGKSRRERERGLERRWTIENRIGGSFCRCRNRWRGFITPVANRNLRAMSFYRKEEARNVRGFCCPRPLLPLPLPPLFPSFLGWGRGGRGERPLLFHHDSSLFSTLGSISRRPRPETGFLPRLFCQSEATRFSVTGRERERGRVVGGYTHDALIGKVGWKRRGDTIEGTSGSVERARDGGKFDADAVGPPLERFWKKGPSFTELGPSGVAQTKEIVALFECFLREPRNRSPEYFLRFVRSSIHRFRKILYFF